MRNYPLLFIPALIFSCSGSNESDNLENSTAQSIIQLPLEGDFQNDTLFKIDPTKENTVETPNGSSIFIPANILVDEDGNPITSTVDLSFVQYHSLSDIVASGIPMDYDSAGTSYPFVSAGMFSIHATANEKPISIKEGSAIDVNLASDKNDPYNFYEMDEKTGHWTFENNPQPVLSNKRYDPSVKPIKPEPATNGAFVLDINFDLSSYSELSVFSGIVWEYTGTHDSLDPRKNKTVGSTKWTDFSLAPTYDKAYEYFLTMKTKGKEFTTRVKAALNGDDFDKALADFQQKKIEVAQKMDDLQKPYIRSVSIDGFGTYNYDYIHQMKEPEPMIADFDFGTKNNDKDKSLIFVVYPEADIVVQYPKEMWGNFALDKSQDSKLLAVMPGNYIAVCKNDLSQSFGKKNHTFKMDVLPDKVTAKNDLERIIAGL